MVEICLKPVVRRGPFVMNSETEIERAYVDFRRQGEQFGLTQGRKPDDVLAQEPETFFLVRRESDLSSSVFSALLSP